MRKILVTGGTVFVSRFIAEHYVAKGDEVYVLNRNTRPQSAAVKLIQADRHAIGDALQGGFAECIGKLQRLCSYKFKCRISGICAGTIYGRNTACRKCALGCIWNK